MTASSPGRWTTGLVIRRRPPWPSSRPKKTYSSPGRRASFIQLWLNQVTSAVPVASTTRAFTSSSPLRIRFSRGAAATMARTHTGTSSGAERMALLRRRSS